MNIEQWLKIDRSFWLASIQHALRELLRKPFWISTEQLKLTYKNKINITIINGRVQSSVEFLTIDLCNESNETWVHSFIFGFEIILKAVAIVRINWVKTPWSRFVILVIPNQAWISSYIFSASIRYINSKNNQWEYCLIQPLCVFATICKT